MSYTPKFPLYKHQSDALVSARLPDGHYKEAFGWLMEMGTGKTKTDIDETCMMAQEQLVDTWLVLAPKGVYLNWIARELPTHIPTDILEHTEIVEWRAGGGSKSHQEKLKDLVRSSAHLRILVMNVEALSTGDKALRFALAFLNSAKRGAKCSVDESTTIKNHKSNRAENVAELAPLCKYRRILTGSPVTRSPLDLFGQFKFLMPRNPLGYSSFYSFRARYAVMQRKVFGGRSVQVVVGYRDVEDLNKQIAPHSFRVKKEDCLDLPPKIYMQRNVEMTDEQKRIYEEIKENATVQLESEDHVTATEVIVQILRLHQVACGHVTDENDMVHDVPNNRIDALMDVISETSGKVIIWSRYRHDIAKIVEAISRTKDPETGEPLYGARSVVQYHGGTSTADREVANDRFQHDPECRFMVSNAQTGGYGNTWTAASTVVYFSNDYDLEKRVQSEDRAHRVGQTKSVTYVDLVVPGTVDEKILKALRNKINISSTVMGDGYREWLI